MKIITLKYLNSIDACEDAIEKFKNKNLEGIEVTQLIEWLIERREEDGQYLNYANWLIVRCMTYNQYVAYAVYAAEQVIDIYESEYPNDNRPRMAIEAARSCLKNPTRESKQKAAAAYSAAARAAAASAAARAAAYSAAADAAASASAASAASAGGMGIKILLHGLMLLKNNKRGK